MQQFNTDRKLPDKKKDVWHTSVAVEVSPYYWNAEPVVTHLDESKLTSAPTIAEFFCGCGGTSLGFEMAGYQVLLGMDIHRPSIDTFSANHPNAAIVLGDIQRTSPQIVADATAHIRPDVMIAGIPCQGFSLNNRKRHAEDRRNYLFLEFARFVEAMQPRAIVIENVSGLGSTKSGQFIDDIKLAMKSASGIELEHCLLHANDYGVPQRRSRLFFVGVKGAQFDFNDVKKTHGPSCSRPFVTVGEAISDLPRLHAGQAKTTYLSDPVSEYQALMRRTGSNKLTSHTAPNHPKSTIERIARTSPGSPMYPRFRQRIRLSLDDLSPTQVSGGIRSQFQFGHPVDSRGLTIRERCRLQSFPDDFEVLGGTVQGRVQTGNAVPPLLAKAVAEALSKYLL